MNGDPVQISMHSNLIYSAFDPRFNVVSLPFIYDSVEDADAKFDGEAGEKMKEILSEYGLHCMGIAENGFRELTNSVREDKIRGRYEEPEGPCCRLQPSYGML